MVYYADNTPSSPNPQASPGNPSTGQTGVMTPEQLYALAQGLINGGALGGTSARDQLLRMKLYYGKAYGSGASANGLSDQYTTVAQAYQDFYNMSDQERLSLGRTMYSFGLVQNPTDYSQIQNAWNKAVEESAYFYSASGRKVSPYDTLAIMAGLRTDWRTQDGKNGLMQGPGNQAKTVTSTYSSANIPSNTQSKALITNIFQNELGRDPTANELNRYTSTLVTAAKKNPTVTTQTTRLRADGSLASQSSTQTGGVDLNQVALDNAKADPEWGSYQAATTYMNALLSAIGNP